MNLHKFKFWKKRIERVIVVSGEMFEINKKFNEEIQRITNNGFILYKIKSLDVKTKDNNEVIQSAIVKFISI